MIPIPRALSDGILNAIKFLYILQKIEQNGKLWLRRLPAGHILRRTCQTIWFPDDSGQQRADNWVPGVQLVVAVKRINRTSKKLKIQTPFRLI